MKLYVILVMLLGLVCVPAQEASPLVSLRKLVNDAFSVICNELDLLHIPF
jgi:hypothetical protein